MTTSHRRFRIVTALDSNEYDEIVLEHALDQAARHDVVDLHFVMVVPNERELDRAKVELASAVRQGLESQSRPDWRSRLHVRAGKTAEEIANLAGELDADLLVIGRFGVHATRKHHSTADRVLEMVACPTLVVGLGEHVLETEQQCPRCVEVREESDGERWFCDAHASPDRLDLTTRLPPSTTSVRGGGVW